ncbi:MAG: DUF5688 family protein [Lachnospiraceae bacterium]|nr:DUF5688 family protein [Lachnospiraceae bacterium]
MATINGIVNVINKKYHLYPKVQTVKKNCVEFIGLCFHEGEQHIAPVIYVDRFLTDDFTDEEAAVYVKQCYDQAGIDIDIDIFKDPTYIREHLFLGLEKKGSDTKYLTRDSAFDDIIEYLYIRDEANVDGTFSVKMSSEHLKSVNITEEEAWRLASEHTSQEIKIETMAEVLCSMMPDDAAIYDNIDDVPMYIFSNHLRMKGAAVVTNMDYVKQWAKAMGFDKIVIIFSSIHEVIILPADDNTDLDAISAMVVDVNKGCVAKEEQLAEKAFIFSVND